MAMILIAGSFRTTGVQPDGDSISFGLTRSMHWRRTTGRPAPISRWTWRTPLPPNYSIGWVSAMLFAHKMKRSHRAPRTRWVGTS